MAGFRERCGEIGRYGGFDGADLALGDRDHEGHARLLFSMRFYSRA
jgi:hypothetical protein